MSFLFWHLNKFWRSLHVISKKKCDHFFCFSVILTFHTPFLQLHDVRPLGAYITLYSLKFPLETYWHCCPSLSLSLFYFSLQFSTFLFTLGSPFQHLAYPLGYAHRRLGTTSVDYDSSSIDLTLTLLVSDAILVRLSQVLPGFLLILVRPIFPAPSVFSALGMAEWDCERRSGICPTCSSVPRSFHLESQAASPAP